MNSGDVLAAMWQQASEWQLLLALASGVVVGYIYFMSLHWSVNRLQKSSHKIGMFATVALLRILLFFGVMVIVEQKNIAVIMIYVVSFFITKMLIVAFEKNKVAHLDMRSEENHD